MNCEGRAPEGCFPGVSEVDFDLGFSKPRDSSWGIDGLVAGATAKACGAEGGQTVSDITQTPEQLSAATEGRLMQRIARARGFSVIEMMVVASILVVLLGMVMPEMVDIASRYRLSGAARGIAGQIALARMRAGAEFTQAHLMANTSAGTYWVEVCSTKNTSTGGCTTFTQEPEDGTHNLPPGIVFGYGTLTTPAGTQSSIGQTTEIRFNSRGIPIDPTALTPTANYALYVTSSPGGQFYAVTVYASGKVSLWHYSGSAWTVM